MRPKYDHDALDETALFTDEHFDLDEFVNWMSEHPAMQEHGQERAQQRSGGDETPRGFVPEAELPAEAELDFHDVYH